MMRVRIVESSLRNEERHPARRRRRVVYDLDSGKAGYLILQGTTQTATDARSGFVTGDNEVMVGVFAGGMSPARDVADEWDDELQPVS